jgi:hypothetical protein
MPSMPAGDGGWAMGDAHEERALLGLSVFAMRTASVRPQTIYPVSRAQRAVCKGRVAAHSVS